MALDRAIRCGNQNVESVYDDRGLFVFIKKYKCIVQKATQNYIMLAKDGDKYGNDQNS